MGTRHHSGSYGDWPRVRWRDCVGRLQRKRLPSGRSGERRRVTSFADAAVTVSPDGGTCARTRSGVGVNRPGAFAEYIALPMTNIWRHHDSIDREVAAIFDPFGNAVHTALSFPVLGEDVLITGAGPIGLMAVPVVRHAGARYIVGDRSQSVPARTSSRNWAPRWRSIRGRNCRSGRCRKRLGMQEGFDVGLEMSGNPSAFAQMIANMSHGAKIAMLGIPSEEMAINWRDVIFNMLTIKGIYGREMYETWYKMTVMLESGLRYYSRDYSSL